MTRIAFLGPEGTFTEKAATEVVAPDPELIPFHTVLAELDAVRSGEVDIAVVAFENSVEGSVPISLDGLATGEPLVIVRTLGSTRYLAGCDQDSCCPFTRRTTMSVMVANSCAYGCI